MSYHEHIRAEEEEHAKARARPVPYGLYAEVNRAVRARLGRVIRPTGPALHGTVSKYTAGCRCDACREALKLYMQSYRLRKKSI